MANSPKTSNASSTTIWNVPLERNPNFIGRDDLIEDLRTNLTGRQPGGRTQVLVGQGGMGKTAVAAEYAHRHRDDYAIVWWLRAEDPIALQSDLVKLGERLKVVLGDAGPDAIREAVRGRLAGRADWLLILDNAPNPQSITDVLPRERSGNVIITSRSSSWPDTRGLNVPALAREESVALLRKRSGVQGKGDIVGRVAQALQDVPLALEQAGALIKQAKLTYEDYLKRFEKHWAELLQRGRSSGDYPDAVAMAWELSYRQVQDSAPQAAQVLTLCGFFASSGIPLGLLEDGNLFLDEPLSSLVADPTKLKAALETLETYSLVNFSGEKIYVQRIVGSLVRRRLSSGDLQKWAATALRLVDFAFKFDPQDVDSWAECAQLLPHVRAAIDHAVAQEEMLDTACSLLNDIGQLLFRQAKYDDAKECLERAMKIGQKVYRADHSKLRSIGNNLGRVLSRLGELDAAKRELEIALEAEEEAHGKDHPQVADLLNNYGACLHKTGDYQGAREQFSRALAIYDLHDIQDEAKAASIINNLGYVFMKQGNLIGARDLFGKALKIAQRGYGSQHPDVAAILNNIGDLHFLERDYESARANYEKALQIDRKVYGQDHPEVARHLGDLGRLFTHTGNPTAGKKYLSQALKIEEATYGPKHPVIGSRLAELGRALQASGDTVGANTLFERAAKINKGAKVAAMVETTSIVPEPAPIAVSTPVPERVAKKTVAPEPTVERVKPKPAATTSSSSSSSSPSRSKESKSSGSSSSSKRSSSQQPTERKPASKDAPFKIGPGIFDE